MKHIPRGNCKVHNPNFTPEIKSLIETRDNTKQSPPFPQTEDTVRTVQSLNEQIRTKIKQQHTENWTNFANNLNHKDNSKQVFQVLRSITKSNSQIPTSHTVITQDNTIPSYTQANILINHYTNISHLPHTPEDRKIATQTKHFLILGLGFSEKHQ